MYPIERSENQTPAFQNAGAFLVWNHRRQCGLDEG